MMVATYKCGCPPPAPDEKPCSPCCASGKGIPPTARSSQNCPASPCCSRQPPKPIVFYPKIEEPPACCPTLPSCEDFEGPPPLRSEIAEKGLPYTEMEAIINNNRIIIRTQKEDAKPEYDPPCDCVEDPSPKPKGCAEEVGAAPAAGTRTVTLFPQAKVSEPESSEQRMREEEVQEEMEDVKTVEKEENPNLFVLRVKKTNTDGDKRFNVDLEFKTPRPWSLQKRLEIENKRKPTKPVEVSEKKGSKKAKRSGKKKKKK